MDQSRIDLFNWLVERLDSEKLEQEGLKLEQIDDGTVHIDGPSGTIVAFGSDLSHELARRDYEVGQLVEIGKSLSSVRDLDKLLDMILAKARFLSGADAGSIYVVEGDAHEITQRKLRFKLSQNDSLDYESKEFAMPISTKSIAGAATVLRETINISDVSNLSEDAPYHYDASWDERTGYSTRSILAVPMTNQSGEVLGVVQLINKKQNPEARLKENDDFDREVIPMDAHSQKLVETLASQAGVAMENAILYAEIQRIFDGFIRASVHAIEQRDPTTSGHSFRVSTLTLALAETVTKSTNGPFADIAYNQEQFDEIETAALLHDFGKVGVREEVLVKAKKLYAPHLQVIQSRFAFIKRSIENDQLHRRIMMIESKAPQEELDILEQASNRAIEEIDDCWRIIRSANEPTVLPAGDFAKIEGIAGRSYFDLGGNRQAFLEADEVAALQIAKGSLTSDELDEIRSHAAKSISFLEQIPWGTAMRNIPKFAGAHHEKLNGTGYPHGLKDKEIPFPAKMMAVADIYDALTASDRPYKKAIPVERALQILRFEAKDLHIDADLVELFEKQEVYRVLDE
jgi:HD-GYP domain-containing protein (c-di-GMP phosphodiesterase class II)